MQGLLGKMEMAIRIMWQTGCLLSPGPSRWTYFEPWWEKRLWAEAPRGKLMKVCKILGTRRVTSGSIQRGREHHPGSRASVRAKGRTRSLGFWVIARLNCRHGMASWFHFMYGECVSVKWEYNCHKSKKLSSPCFVGYSFRELVLKVLALFIHPTPHPARNTTANYRSWSVLLEKEPWRAIPCGLPLPAGLATAQPP